MDINNKRTLLVARGYRLRLFQLILSGGPKRLLVVIACGLGVVLSEFILEGLLCRSCLLGGLRVQKKAKRSAKH